MLLIVDSGLFPWVSLQMADAPCIAHGITRRGALGMEAVVDHRKAVVTGAIDLAVGKTRAETLRIVKAVEIDLRLGMVMGRIGGPFSGEIQHLAQHHSRKRS